jgi:peptidoglycan hydrolase-like protein with peptidoglycan-binding domain
MAALAAALSLPALAQNAKVIATVQEKLGVLPADGQMTPKTEDAIKEFQRAKGIQPSGQLDKKTLTALGMGEPKPKPAASGASAQDEGKPSTPIGPQQSSGERAAEPKIKTDRPTGETK